MKLRALLAMRRLLELQAFFRFCLLKRKQAFVAISWQIEDAICRVVPGYQNHVQGPLAGAGVLPHRQKTFALVERISRFNRQLLAKARALMKARLLMCTSSAASLIGREDGRVSLEPLLEKSDFLETILQQTRKFRAGFERDKNPHSWTPMPLDSYELTEEDTKHARGLILIKSALLLHSRHSRRGSARQSGRTAPCGGSESPSPGRAWPPADDAAGEPRNPGKALRSG